MADSHVASDGNLPSNGASNGTPNDLSPTSTTSSSRTQISLEIDEKHIGHIHDPATKDDFSDSQSISTDGKDGGLEGPQSEKSGAALQEIDVECRDPSAAAADSKPAHSSFSTSKKRYIVFMTAFASFFSPLTANIYFPALTVLARTYHVSNSLMNLTLTTYLLFQGLAPTFIGGLADSAGRRPAYIIGFVIYIAACIGIALQNSFPALLVLRCMQSTGSSGTIALGSGVVADIATADERGTYMGWATGGALIGPAVGPILGGLLSQYLGWRAIFWFLAILAGTYFTIFLITFPETARAVVGDGSIPPKGWNMSLLNYIEVRRHRADARRAGLDPQSYNDKARQQLASARKIKFPNPLNSLRLVMEKDIALLLLYNCLVYTAFYDVTSSLPSLLEAIYGYDNLQIGLCFIPFGVGCFTAAFVNGRMLDWNFRRLAKKYGIRVDKRRGTSLKGFPVERVRVQIGLPLVLGGVVALLCYGWVMEAETHIAVPLILLYILGFCLNGSFNCMSVMLVDNYPSSPSTAIAANNLIRCTMGAGGTAIILYMIEAMGRGWCFTFISVVVMLASPILLVLMTKGPVWREARRVRMESRQHVVKSTV